MKKYTTPDIDTIKFDNVDVIQTSSGGNFEIVDGDAADNSVKLEGSFILGA